MRRLLLVLLLITLLLSTACASIQPVQSMTVDESIQLLPELDEMPAGFYLNGEVSRLLSNEELAQTFRDEEDALATFNELGRQGGWYVDYTSAQRHLFGKQNHRLAISVIVFNDEEGAQEYTDEAMKRETTRKGKQQRPYELSMPPLGDRSTLFVMEIPDDALPGSKYALFTSRRNIVLAVEAQSLKDSGDVDQMIDLASQILAELN